MSDFEVLLYVTIIVVGVGLATIFATGVRALRATIPKELRAKYSKRLINRSQMPFTEKWMESVDPNDLLVLVKARTRRSLFLMAGAIFTYLVLILRVLQLHLVIRMLVDHAH